MTAIVTDSAGNRARATTLRDVKPGDKIVGGWKPWAEVERVETVDDEGRIYYTTHGPTQWFPLDQEFYVEVEA